MTAKTLVSFLAVFFLAAAALGDEDSSVQTHLKDLIAKADEHRVFVVFSQKHADGPGVKSVDAFGAFRGGAGEYKEIFNLFTSTDPERLVTESSPDFLEHADNGAFAYLTHGLDSDSAKLTHHLIDAAQSKEAAIKTLCYDGSRLKYNNTFTVHLSNAQKLNVLEVDGYSLHVQSVIVASVRRAYKSFKKDEDIVSEIRSGLEEAVPSHAWNVVMMKENGYSRVGKQNFMQIGVLDDTLIVYGRKIR